MSDDPYKDLLARFEAMHRETLAELRGLREDGRARDDAAADLTRLRRSAADRKATSRARERAELAVTRQSRPSRDSHATPVVVKALDPKLRDQDQKPPPSRDGHGTARQPGPTTSVWNAYAAAYEKRHGCEPADGKSERGKLMRFIEKVPKDEAPEIAAFFLKHNDALYLRAKHPIDLLVRDAQRLRTEWKTGRTGTSTAARQQDQTQANLDGWAEHMSEEGRRALVEK